MITYNESVKTVTSKNLIPICILKILEDHSDYNHKLTQQDIIDYLRIEYQVDSIERKAIGRTIERLQEELEIGIESDRGGCWLEPRDFEDYELHMLIDSIFTSRYIPRNYSRTLIKKISALGNEYFNDYVKYTFTTDNLSKNENQSIFFNIELIDEAITKNRQISFSYNKWGVDKKLHYSSPHTATPYRMIVHNQKYYLMCYEEYHKNIAYYRIDHMTNMKVLKDKVGTSIRKVPGWEGGITNKNMATNLPYMFADKQERITFYATPMVIDQMIDWLGFDVDIKKLGENEDKRMKLSIISSPEAMKYFALQYLDDIEILTPVSLREEIKKSLKKAANKYK